LCLLKSIMQEMAVEISNIDIISQLGGWNGVWSSHYDSGKHAVY
jgi:hypothetical protein